MNLKKRLMGLYTQELNVHVLRLDLYQSRRVRLGMEEVFEGVHHTSNWAAEGVRTAVKVSV